MKVNYKILVAGIMFLLAGQSCTDLSETNYNVIIPEEFGGTPQQQAALIGPLYAKMSRYYGIADDNNTVTDETVVPTRGGDWDDSGGWRRLKTQTWLPTSDGSRFDGYWTWGYSAIAAVNLQIAAGYPKPVVAELRVLRAWYHYVLLDLFRNIIIAEKVGETAPSQKSGAEVYAWIVKEVKESYPDLSEDVGGSYYGRMNKWAASMLLAKLYLNASVYTGTVSATSVTMGPGKWAETKEQCDIIINSGKYSLSSVFLSNFLTQNQGSKENILAIPFDGTKKPDMTPQMKTLHYASKQTYGLADSPWNGFCAATDFYTSFQEGDDRRGMWIVGQQYAADGTPLLDDGVPLIFKPEIPSLKMDAGVVARAAGARSQKYEIQRNAPTSNQDNDFAVWRLADVYLMRAEANMRLGNTAAAIQDVNVVRNRAHAKPVTTLTLNDILAERGWELAWEGMRRQDLIRFGQFNKAWQFKPDNSDKPYTQVFPIPIVQIGGNPNLKQNPGY